MAAHEQVYTNGSSKTTSWMIVIAVVTVLINVSGGLWSVVNPRNDLVGIKADLEKELSAVKRDLRDAIDANYRADAATRENVTREIEKNVLKFDKYMTLREHDEYQKRIDTALERQFALLNELNKQVTGGYNLKDALNSLQLRIDRLDTWARDRKPVHPDPTN